MKLTILDASVAIKWFVHEDGQEKALAVLDRIQDTPESFAVPELFFSEMLSVFCRILTNAGQIQKYLETLQDLGLERLGNGRQTLNMAAILAKDTGLRGYDAIYAANAKLTGGIWLTADAKAHQKILRLKISALL